MEIASEYEAPDEPMPTVEVAAVDIAPGVVPPTVVEVVTLDDGRGYVVVPGGMPEVPVLPDVARQMGRAWLAAADLAEG